MGKFRKFFRKHSDRPHQTKSWSGFWVQITLLALISSVAGGLFAVFLQSKPFLQANLSADAAKFLNSDRLSEGIFLQLNRPVNILVMGMSVLPPDIQNPPPATKELGYLPQVNSFDGLSDVMLLIRFDPQKQKLNMLSIPRDTRTQIEGHGLRKINAANHLGGPYLSAKTVSELLGVKIDGYVRINVLGVGKLIDALGGVTVDVPKDLQYQDDSQHLYINLKAGRQHLNGDQALQLLRFRHDSQADIGRIQRQHLVIQALIAQTLNPTILGRSPIILHTVKDNLDTNLTVDSLLTLINFGVGINRSNIEMLTLPGRVSLPSEFDASYWLADEVEIQAMMARYFDVNNSELQPPIQ